MPGLLRGVARTAVIAGTATAVSGRVQRRQAERFADRDAEIYAERQLAYEQATTSAPPAPEGAATQDVLTQLERLGDLKAQGVLTEAEFEAQKAKLLNA